MSNTGITLVDVRQEAMDAIRKLKSGYRCKNSRRDKRSTEYSSGYGQNTGCLYSVDPKYNKRTDVCE